MKYKKKPVIIDAHLWEGNQKDMESWLSTQIVNTIKITAVEFSGHWAKRQMEIHTLEGTMQVSYGDYVIRGVDGELYPCKPDIFEKTYEQCSEWDIAVDEAVVDMAEAFKEEADKQILSDITKEAENES